MRLVGGLGSLFWTLAIGVIALYVFFLVLGGLAPSEIWLLTVVAVVLAVMLVVHFALLRHQLSEHGPSDTRRRLNRMREGRGF